MTDPNPAPPFEIGLVMAGAISAGAYTAGVIDFLIQALDAWEEAKNGPASDDVPKHRVLLRVMAGASAGGMTAGLAVGQLGLNFQSVTAVTYPPAPAQEPKNNNLYKSWVNMIDISRLLEVQDLADENVGVKSVLDSTVLGEIAAAAFQYDDPTDLATQRSYLADPLHVFLTVTNLRGVPYKIDFRSAGVIEYVMRRNADSMYFVRSTTDPAPDEGALRLDPAKLGKTPSWGVLQNTALATGAFPIGLAPRALNRPVSDYLSRSRQWVIPGLHIGAGGQAQCGRLETVPPFWTLDKDHTYQFLCVDGGVLNNEPIDLARQILAGPHPFQSEGGQATRTLLMIEPFPTTTQFPDPPQPPLDPLPSLFDLISMLFNGLISQARFKPEEVVLAADPDDYSRFIVIPRRQETSAAEADPHAIACGTLRGFGGFLSRAFREHAYQLGRRNCQRFLLKHFTLPCDEPAGQVNPLFQGGTWSDAAKEKFRVVCSKNGIVHDGKVKEAPDDLFLLPIIPVMDSVAAEIPLAPWPTYSVDDDLANLRDQVGTRLDAIVGRLIDLNATFASGAASDPNPGLLAHLGSFGAAISTTTLRSALHIAWLLKRGEVINYIMDMIRTDLGKTNGFGVLVDDTGARAD